jgi:methyl-accepting chemotaxis protein
MDQTTQQNAALVEQMAAAASSLKSQASDLVQVVAVFKLAQGQQAPQTQAPAAKVVQSPSATPVAKKLNTPARAPALAAATKLVAKPAAPAAPAKRPPALAAAPQVSRVQTPAGGDEDWETF